MDQLVGLGRRSRQFEFLDPPDAERSIGQFDTVGNHRAGVRIGVPLTAVGQNLLGDRAVGDGFIGGWRLIHGEPRWFDGLELPCVVGPDQGGETVEHPELDRVEGDIALASDQQRFVSGAKVDEIRRHGAVGVVDLHLPGHFRHSVPGRLHLADAEWALQSGETVTTSLGEFKAADPLPERDFFAVGLTSDKNNTVTNLGCLNGLTSLTSLNGKGQQITEEWLTHVEQLKNLEKLIVVSSNMSDAGLAQLEGPSNLNQLELISNRQLSGTGFQHLVESNVTVLDCNESAGITDTGLQQLKGMTQLVQLQLMGTQVTDDGLHTSTG